MLFLYLRSLMEEFTNNYIDELNDGQRAAVLYTQGPSLVIAGAGSGKTRVLTYKIAHLLQQGYRPWSILALTFTNKAAREMKERIANLVGGESARYLWMGTFHSMFLRILRAESAELGFSPKFTIYDAADSKSLIRAIIKEMKLDEKQYKPGAVQARISSAKNHLVTPASYAANKDAYKGDCDARMPAIRDIYRRYWERCRQADAMDFDDLLLYTFLLFRDKPEVLARYQQQFGYVLVDEYQDTNYAQHCIVLQLSKQHQRVCVVGDDAQSIYSFRGADIDNILYFTKVYPDTKVFKLEQNYRSTQTIVCAANSLIAKNQRQIRKEVFSEKERGEALGVFQAYSDIEEADIVVNKIIELRRREQLKYSDYAILYRTNAQSRVFEESMRKRSIPYRIYGGLSFYHRKEVKDVIAYFRLVVNPNDEEAFKRIINYPARGIGDTTLGKIVAAASEYGVSLWTILQEPLAYGLNFNKGVTAKLQAFKTLMLGFMNDSLTKNAAEMGQDIIQRAGIMNEVCQDNTPENLSRKENIEELVNGMGDFCAQRLEEGDTNITLTDYLSEVSLLTDQDSDDDSEEKVTLMTVHAAKGLEFPVVFVVGLEEELFPSAMCLDSMRAIEEERRLFYVAITRAERHCFLSYAKSRMRYGKMEFAAPSRFLKDIDVRYLRLPGQMAYTQREEPRAPVFTKIQLEAKPTFTPSTPRNLKPVAAAAVTVSSQNVALSVGQYIEHERFGLGEVLKVEGEGDSAKALIRFENAGEKQLLLRFARFKVV